MPDNRINVLRCTALNEEIYIPRQKCALLVEDVKNPIPQGYGAYLIPQEDYAYYANNPLAYPGNISFQPGDMLLIREEAGSRYMSMLRTADRAERTLFLTGRCNSNCIMCPYGTKMRTRACNESVSLLLACISLMNPYAEYLCVTGGEPTLLKDDFLKILETIKEHFVQCEVHILTNGRAFHYADFLEDYRKVRPYKTLLGIPLHASYAELHDRITGMPGSFAQTVRGLDRLCAANEHVELRVVVSALNNGNLTELAEFIGNRYPRVNHVSLMGLEMMGNAMLRRQEVWLSFDQIWPQVSRAIEILLHHGVSVQIFNFPLCNVEKRFHSLYRRSISPEKVRYMPECEECILKDRCGGFFQTTIHMPDISVHPFK